MDTQAASGAQAMATITDGAVTVPAIITAPAGEVGAPIMQVPWPTAVAEEKRPGEVAGPASEEGALAVFALNPTKAHEFVSLALVQTLPTPQPPPPVHDYLSRILPSLLII